ncbi:MAG: dTDP-4-dehydrorhamnose 3,5-epimerase family protein [Bryobacterales bacterium]
MGQPIAEGNGILSLRTPDCDKGIGTLISKPDAAGLISGVKIEPFPLWPDDRGYFIEVARMGQGMIGEFDPGQAQVSAAMSYPGTIKAFHYHLHQTDYWAAAAGMLQVALVDLREGSPTFGARNTMYVGALRSWRILIPPGVGHGYKVVGLDPALLVYVTNRQYNPKDEGRIPYNDPAISYDWDFQYK